ncbi:MAG: phosphotransferase family protein [Rudaea sp.]|uniref:phosphotransferase family protein n=1 Tax=Rudaea sp. TaxID=2136325 RepID=UPI0039E5122C
MKTTTLRKPTLRLHDAAAVAAADKNKPSAEWIAQLRKRFPVEKEIDRVLTRKLEHRATSRFTPVPLDKLVEGVRSLISAQSGGTFTIDEPRWLSGGASKLQMRFVLDRERPGAGREKTPMVLRMEPAESIVETSRLREFQLIRAMHGVVPVPPVFWCDSLGEHLPYPSLVYGFAKGVTKPSTGSSGVTGLGMRLPKDVREKLKPQFIEQLVRIHAFDHRTADFSAFDMPGPGTDCALKELNMWERIWEEDHDEDVPLLRLAAAWLRRNLPALDVPSVVHGDYRVGNFLFDEDDGCRITAWLDWENGLIGNRHRDLAYISCSAFRSPDENGNILLNGLMSENEFFEVYEKASGRKIDRKTLHWYKVFNAYYLAILIVATGYRIAWNGKTHQDILVTWLIGIGGSLLNDLHQLLEQGA